MGLVESQLSRDTTPFDRKAHHLAQHDDLRMNGRSRAILGAGGRPGLMG